MSERKFLFIMDPYETLNLETETSLLLMEELIGRGVAVYWVEVDGLLLRQNSLMAKARRVHSVEPFNRSGVKEMPVERFDAVVPRLDPPFDERYLHVSYLLDFVPSHVRQFNRGASLRNMNEKLLPLFWPDVTPPTLTGMDAGAIRAFLEEHEAIVLKPLGDCSGRGIVKLQASDAEAGAQIADFLKDAEGRPRFVQAQVFLPEVSAGDKRVYLVNGKPIGVVNRVPREGGYLANIHQGAEVTASELSRMEAGVLRRIEPCLVREGLLMVGADFIGGRLTELNITSPSAIRQINQVSKRAVHPLIVDAMLDAVTAGRGDKAPNTPPMRLCCA